MGLSIRVSSSLERVLEAPGVFGLQGLCVLCDRGQVAEERLPGEQVEKLVGTRAQVEAEIRFLIEERPSDLDSLLCSMEVV